MLTPDPEFGARLRRARREQGLSQGEVAAGLATASFLSLVESGKRAPSPKLAAALAARLGIAVDPDESPAPLEMPDLVAALAAVRIGDIEAAIRHASALGITTAERLLVDGLVLEHRGELTDATRHLEAALTAAPDGDLRFEIAAALCRVAFNAGNLALATEVGEQALVADTIETPRTEDLRIEIRATLSGVYCDSGNLARARELVDGDHLHTETPAQRGQHLWARSIVAFAEGDVERAGAFARAALEQFRFADRPLSLARLQVTAAALRTQSEAFDVDEVLGLMGAAEQTFRTLDIPFDLAGCLTARAAVLAQHGDQPDARTALEEALLLVRDEGAGFRARVYAAAALVFLQIGDRAAATAHLLEARELLESAGASRAAAAAWRQLADGYEQLGQLDLALACMKATTDLLGVFAQAPAGAHAVR